MFDFCFYWRADQYWFSGRVWLVKSPRPIKHSGRINDTIKQQCAYPGTISTDRVLQGRSNLDAMAKLLVLQDCC